MKVFFTGPTCEKVQCASLLYSRMSPFICVWFQMRRYVWIRSTSTDVISSAIPPFERLAHAPVAWASVIETEVTSEELDWKEY